ncbi:hypothetical protein CRENBAI_015274 [Crenichthys baileyi]|uniref:Uncharacterized protein n=1 Tax=Crenichthys baileyi TaxID=28760 RepID=A0AAV9SKH6_9TELE
MEEYTSGDDGNFNTDETSVLVKECIEGVIGGTDYNQNKVNLWTANMGSIPFSRELYHHAEEWCRSPHSQFLLLGHHYRRKLHCPVGEPHHVLCGQCICCVDVTTTPSCSSSLSKRRQL